MNDGMGIKTDTRIPSATEPPVSAVPLEAKAPTTPPETKPPAPAAPPEAKAPVTPPETKPRAPTAPPELKAPTPPDTKPPAPTAPPELKAPTPPDTKPPAPTAALVEGNVIEQLNERIDLLQSTIPQRLKDRPDVQKVCLDLLEQAALTIVEPVTPVAIIQCKSKLALVEVEFNKADAGKISLFIVAAVLYLTVGLAASASVLMQKPEELKGFADLLGVPVPILLWAVIGTMTSMLLRAGQSPFATRFEAYRWLIFRPVVGVVMGILTYLMVIAGLIVFAGTGSPAKQELMWIVAFVGGFSDTLSVNLLQSIMGRIDVTRTKPVATESTPSV